MRNRTLAATSALLALIGAGAANAAGEGVECRAAGDTVLVIAEGAEHVRKDVGTDAGCRPAGEWGPGSWEHGVQLAATRKAASAEKAWRIVTRKSGELSGDDRHVIMAPESYGGSLYRLIVPVRSAQAAGDRCAAIKRSGGDCYRVFRKDSGGIGPY